MSRKQTKSVRVKRITNRLLESRAKLDGYSRQGITAIRPEADSQAGMYIRPGTLSEKTGRIGAHAIYCQLKTGRKHRIAKLDDIATRESDRVNGQMMLAEVEQSCRRWREQGRPDSMIVVAPSPDRDNEASEAHSLFMVLREVARGRHQG